MSAGTCAGALNHDVGACIGFRVKTDAYSGVYVICRHLRLMISTPAAASASSSYTCAGGHSQGGMHRGGTQLSRGRRLLPTVPNPKSAGLVEPVVTVVNETDVSDCHSLTKGDEGHRCWLNMEVRKDVERFEAAKKMKFSSKSLPNRIRKKTQFMHTKSLKIKTKL